MREKGFESGANLIVSAGTPWGCTLSRDSVEAKPKISQLLARWGRAGDCERPWCAAFSLDSYIAQSSKAVGTKVRRNYCSLLRWRDEFASDRCRYSVRNSQTKASASWRLMGLLSSRDRFEPFTT